MFLCFKEVEKRSPVEKMPVKGCQVYTFHYSAFGSNIIVIGLKTFCLPIAAPSLISPFENKAWHRFFFECQVL
jgi:hypothetical protein